MGQRADFAGIDAGPGRIRHLSLARPFVWLRAGLDDMRRTPIASLAYGLLFSIAGDVLLLSVWQSPRFFAIAISGFVFFAPLLCAGLYELSRRSERGQESRFVDSLTAFSRPRGGLLLFAAMALLLWVAWERFSDMLFSLMVTGQGTLNAVQFAATVSAPGGNTQLAAAWVGVGGLLTLAAFVFSIVTVPMLVDRNCTFSTAATTSLHAFEKNMLPMLLWAGIIAAVTLIGFATLLFGFVVFMPLLGHASWHAYRDLVE
jgi:uncharacterized membrane protein